MTEPTANVGKAVGEDGLLPLLSTEEMLARNIVPVKAEYLIRKV